MGLDAYLCATGKMHRRQTELAEKLEEFKLKLYRKKYAAIFKDAPKTKDGYPDIDNFSKELDVARFEFISALDKKAIELGGVRTIGGLFLLEGAEPVDQIAYFDRDLNLHKFIMKLCWKKKKDYEAREVYLSESTIRKIIKKFSSDEDGEYISFRTALYVVKGGGEVFYRAI